MKNICNILGVECQSSGAKITGVSIDTRTLLPGDLFIALQGERLDGHGYVGQALEKGAAAALVSHKIGDGARQIVVPDTFKAMYALAVGARDAFKGPVIGVTGSSGKTTTKEELAFLLGAYGKTLASSKNLNNHIGVPLNLIRLLFEPADFAVIEAGMSHAGELARTGGVIRPDVALVTNVYPMHIEFFENIAGIARAKAELFEHAKTAVYNGETNEVGVLEAEAKRYGVGKLEPFYPSRAARQGREVEAEVAGKKLRYTLAEDSRPMHENALACLHVIAALGLDPAKALPKIAEFGLLEGRGKSSEVKLPGGGTFTLVDDSYSGQPEAMKLALEALAKRTGAGRRIAVLGKMGELGTHEKAEHEGIGRIVAGLGLDAVVFVGAPMKDALAQCPPSLKTDYFETNEGLARFVKEDLARPGDVILFKGSHYGSRLFETVQTLLTPREGDHLENSSGSCAS